VLTYASSANAWLAPPEPEAFALAIRAAVERPDPGRVSAARQTAAQHDWSIVADRWFSLYDEVFARFGEIRLESVPTVLSS
jgi:hypothetical protein